MAGCAVQSSLDSHPVVLIVTHFSGCFSHGLTLEDFTELLKGLQLWFVDVFFLTVCPILSSLWGRIS